MAIIPHCLNCNASYSWLTLRCDCGTRTISGWALIVGTVTVTAFLLHALYNSPIAVGSRRKQAVADAAAALEDSLYAQSRAVRRTCEDAVEIQMAPYSPVEWGLSSPTPVDSGLWRLNSFVDFQLPLGRRKRIKYSCLASRKANESVRITRLDLRR